MNDIDKGISFVERVQRQIPYALHVSLNKAAWDLRRLERREIVRVFKNPKAFTRNAILYERSKSKRDLHIAIFARDKASRGTPPSKYLEQQVFGGVRDYKKFETRLTVTNKNVKGMSGNYYGMPPRNSKNNRFTKARVKKLIQGAQNRDDKKFFFLKRGRAQGIWEKYGRGQRKIRLVMYLTKRKPTYTKRFMFFNVGIRHGERLINKHFPVVLQKVLRNEGIIDPTTRVSL